jgi:hypothetical protein
LEQFCQRKEKIIGLSKFESYRHPELIPRTVTKPEAQVLDFFGF